MSLLLDTFVALLEQLPFSVVKKSNRFYLRCLLRSPLQLNGGRTSPPQMKASKRPAPNRTSLGPLLVLTKTRMSYRRRKEPTAKHCRYHTNTCKNALSLVKWSLLHFTLQIFSSKDKSATAAVFATPTSKSEEAKQLKRPKQPPFTQAPTQLTSPKPKSAVLPRLLKMRRHHINKT